MNRDLRIGVLVDDVRVPAYVAATLEAVVATGVAELTVVIKNAAHRTIDLRAKLRRLPGKVLYHAYRDFVVAGSRAYREVDLHQVLGSTFDSTVVLHCRPVPVDRHAVGLADDDLAAVQAMDLDVLLRFGFNIIRGPVLDAARHGVWSFHFDDERHYRGGPPCFWELYEGEARIEPILQRLTDTLDAGIVLRRGSFPVAPGAYLSTLNTVAFGVAPWPAELCVRLYYGEGDGAFPVEPSATTAPIYVNPTNGEMVRFFARTFRARLMSRSGEPTV